MDLQDVKNKIAEKYECLGWDMLMLNLTLSGDFRRDYKITETMVWNELAETYASLQCAEMNTNYRRQSEMLINAVNSISIQVYRLESHHDRKGLQPVIDDLKTILRGPIDTSPMDELKLQCAEMKETIKTLRGLNEVLCEDLRNKNEQCAEMKKENERLKAGLEKIVAFDPEGKDMQWAQIVSHIQTLAHVTLNPANHDTINKP